MLKNNKLPDGISSIVTGDYQVGEWMTSDTEYHSFLQREVFAWVKSSENGSKRLGRSLLELGGNNAIIVTPSADLKLVFDRCGVWCSRHLRSQDVLPREDLSFMKTSMIKLRIFLVKACKQLKIGNPLDAKNHVGPLIDKAAVEMFLNAIKAAKDQGAHVLVEGGALKEKTTIAVVMSNRQLLKQKIICL